MSWIKFNINNNVKVRLTDKGKEMIKKCWNGSIPDWFENYNEGDGYYKFQLHDLAKTFGKELYNGNMNPPFETEIYLQVDDIPNWLKNLIS